MTTEVPPLNDFILGTVRPASYEAFEKHLEDAHALEELHFAYDVLEYKALKTDEERQEKGKCEVSMSLSIVFV